MTQDYESTRMSVAKHDLLAALERVMTVFPEMCADVGMCDDPYTMSIINQARAAIEKAKGS